MNKNEREDKLDEAVKKIQGICNDYNVTIDSILGNVMVAHHDSGSDMTVCTELHTVPF